MDPKLVLDLSDDKLLDHIFAALTKSVDSDANAYSEDGAYARAIRKLPVGLRAMAATHHLDISLTLDDIGWHFLNFGEPALVKETEAGLHELDLDDLADWFAEAHGIVTPLRGEIGESGDYYDCLTKHGQMARIQELTKRVDDLERFVHDSPIYSAWVRYTRRRPGDVFGADWVL